MSSVLRLGAVLAVGSLLAIGGGTVHAGDAQPDPDITGTIAVNPASTTPGTVVVATATFTNTGPGTTWSIDLNLEGTDGAGTFDLASVVTSAGVGACVDSDGLGRSVRCPWTPAAPGEAATVSVNINVAASATPESPGWLVGAAAGVRSLAQARLEIVAAPVDPPVVDPPVVDPPVVDPPVVNPPASGGTPTATPTQLPATGTSTWPLVLIGFAALAAGAGAIRLSRSR